ncbi:MAG: DUF3392 family protein [bacterium]
MEYLHEFAVWLAGLLRPHLRETSVALVATVLVIYGGNINSALKQQIQGLNVVFRLLIFIAVCAFGYGVATVFLASLVELLLADLSPVSLVIAIVGFFILVGILAERKKAI